MARAAHPALKLLWAALALALLAYAGACALMYSQQRALMYFPQGTRLDAIHTDFQLDRGDAVLRGWVLNPGREDALLYFGGNAEAVEGMRTRLRAWFPDRTVYLLAYRGYGASDGAPEEALLFDDALALFDHAKAAHGEGRIAVVGRSLGSGVASYVAGQRPVDRLVLVTPFDSLVAVAQGHYPWLPAHWLLKDRYESDRHLAGYAGPLLVVRAGRDRVVPPANTDRLIDGLPKAPQVLVLPEASHDSVFNDDDAADAITRFLRD
ncbi:MAG TPA: alpha/beta fold hydrolase [Arenimonas sp.]|uniref:alpha/beta hydrolase n=1 Tax=Arenimonas sp. TaxID=1872635 RepID=UPI002D80D36D|nr:alpha/beta fold hydrolase [Arenimonas sp.]HEU0153344.1 alpha/beta fold hydrolase [Arenimonas sp.]